MPTYEYRCPEGHEFERFYRKISDAEAVVVCPVCSKVAERRLSAGTGLVFKGSGFYLTDYGKNAHRKPVESGATGDSKGEGKTETDAKSRSEDKSDGQPATPKLAAKTDGVTAAPKVDSKAGESKSGSGKSGSGKSGSAPSGPTKSES